MRQVFFQLRKFPNSVDNSGLSAKVLPATGGMSFILERVSGWDITVSTTNSKIPRISRIPILALI